MSTGKEAYTGEEMGDGRDVMGATGIDTLDRPQPEITFTICIEP